MKKIYLAGSGGMLGEAFYEVFNTEYEIKASDINLTENWLQYLDFRNLGNYKKDVYDFKPDYLFHLGAITSLEQCDLNINLAYSTNTIGVENATLIANNLNIPIVYISTAGIFDGKKDLYDDWDIPNPLGHYARSKYNGELYVEQNAKKYLILRAGWMMGGGPKKDKKFVNKIYKQIIDKKKIINVVNDKLGTPTYTIDFAKNTKLLLEKNIWGKYNLVSEGASSRIEVAKEILKILNKTDEVILKEVDSNFFSKEYFSLRPRSERLINKKLNLRKLNIMRDWKICLKEYLNEKFIN
tara:strand:- start:2073 stop:2963 length:891 start_codon:yes stop_codon:yes gene_type:complete